MYISRDNKQSAKFSCNEIR